MSPPILIVYASKHGSTHEVADAIAATLAEQGTAVEVRPADAVATLDGYAGVILGGALYMGRLHRNARGFLKHHRAALAQLPFAVYAMGPINEDERQFAGARDQLDRALHHTPELHPVSTAIFGGVINPGELHFPMSRMPASDLRDWEGIRAWAEEAVAGIAAASAAPRSG